MNLNDYLVVRKGLQESIKSVTQFAEQFRNNEPVFHSYTRVLQAKRERLNEVEWEINQLSRK